MAGQRTPERSAGGTTKIGAGLPRVDGVAKVTGTARYAADHAIEPTPYVGWIVGAPIAHGRVVKLDTAAAEEAPGIVTVVTHVNAPDQQPFGQPEDAGRFAISHAVLASDEVRHHGDPVALVIGRTLEAARAAARLVEVEYAPDSAAVCRFEDTPDHELETPDELDGGLEADVARGDFDGEYEAAERTLDVVFHTPGQISAAMEPHATIAEWQGGKLTLHTSIQIVASAVQAIANTFGLQAEDVRIRAPYVGGGFGSKLGIHHDAVLAAIGAMVTDHPVRVVQTRRNVFENAPHRSPSRQRVRIGATAEGDITAIGHDSVMSRAHDYAFAEPCAAGARASYSCLGLRTTHRVAVVHMPLVDSMRAPGEAIGTLALESALDELALQLELDPLELRLRNIAATEPASGKPFVQNHLKLCLETGAERFGWRERPQPGQREGRQLIGWGMAGCTRMHMMQKARARVRLGASGGRARVTVEADMTDIGTGTYTILTQIACDVLGLAVADVDVRLGDSDLPQTAGSGGSFGAASTGGAVLKACRALRSELTQLAAAHQDSPLKGAKPGDMDLADGQITAGDQVLSFARLVELHGAEFAVEEGAEPGAAHDDHAQYSYGAHFVELRVDAATGEVRLKRALGAFSFGRVLNALTARSQLIGGMTYGIGGALTESLMLDTRYGAFMNRDFAEYHLPVQRDVPDLEVCMLGESDERASPLGSKGLGELALCGIGAAIANAVAHATGARIREFPITPDKVLAQLRDH